MTLVIVESPTKAKTINRFLGKHYKVISSGGHVLDLKKGNAGIDTKNNFELDYEIIPKAEERVKEIEQLAKKEKEVILATDEDREGEAIAYHLAQILKLKKNTKRIVFHEITENAIKHSLDNPRTVDMQLVDAQKARRVLDRLVGFGLSPFLWAKISYGLSAGRVQSVALRLIVEKEKEIQAFKPQDYWNIVVHLLSGKHLFEAEVATKNGKPIGKMGIDTEKKAQEIVAALKKASYTIAKIEQKKRTKRPYPPFRTSTLQQAAAARFGYTAKRTMMIAQHLYEKGFTTYPRTDSLNLSQDAVAQARNYIQKEIGDAYLPEKARFYKSEAKGAQEAHESIRPAFDGKTTLASRAPQKMKLTPQEKKLYTLIWQRFIASQMQDAVQLATTVEIDTQTPYGLHATGAVTEFDGFTKVYPVQLSENELPPLKEQTALKAKSIDSNKHTTQPPPRFSDASLVKTLEQQGIGRPSTYASIISTIQERNYVEKNDQKRLQPTAIGVTVNDIIVKNFSDIVNTGFTATMEEDLDKIAIGKKDWHKTLKAFYTPFEKNLTKKMKEVKSQKIAKPTKEKCPQCGEHNLVEKNGRFGAFFACEGYPKCRFTKPRDGEEGPPQPKHTGEKCPDCGEEILERVGKFGAFFACSGYPKCKFSKPKEDKNAFSVPCVKCVEGLVKEKRTKKGKIFYGCNKYPDCDFALWDKPVVVKDKQVGKDRMELCPKCKDKTALVEKKAGVVCSNKECGYKPRKK